MRPTDSPASAASKEFDQSTSSKTLSNESYPSLLPSGAIKTHEDEISPIGKKRQEDLSYLVRAFKISKNLSEFQPVTQGSEQHYSLLYQLVALGEILKTSKSKPEESFYEGDDTTTSAATDSSKIKIMTKVSLDTKNMIDSKIGVETSVSLVEIRDRLFHPKISIPDLESGILGAIEQDKESLEILSKEIDRVFIYRTDREIQKIIRDLDGNEKKALKLARDVSCIVKRMYPEEDAILSYIDTTAQEIQKSKDFASVDLAEKKENLKKNLNDVSVLLKDKTPTETTAMSSESFFSHARSFVAQEDPRVDNSDLLSVRMSLFEESSSKLTEKDDHLDSDISNSVRWHINMIVQILQHKREEDKISVSEKSALDIIRKFRNKLSHKPTEKLGIENIKDIQKSLSAFREAETPNPSARKKMKPSPLSNTSETKTHGL